MSVGQCKIAVTNHSWVIDVMKMLKSQVKSLLDKSLLIFCNTVEVWSFQSCSLELPQNLNLKTLGNDHMYTIYSCPLAPLKY